jgi:cytochrome c oxidase subunit III
MTTHVATPTRLSSDGPIVAHHFDDWQQQSDSCLLGMWTFLISEVMFFGGLFATYMTYRYLSPLAFAHASQELDVLLGTVNTAILLTSSLTMALGVREAHLSRARPAAVMLALTLLLGMVFLGIKFYEYYHKVEEGLAPVLHLPFQYHGEDSRAAQVFLGLYFGMTGVHALHMIIGIGVLAILIAKVVRSGCDAGQALSVEIIGLYWHFVDLIWVFLFPLLYLIDRSV